MHKKFEFIIRSFNKSLHLSADIFIQILGIHNET